MLFHELFVGGSQAHGIWDNGAQTVREPASPTDYEAHLAGRLGLGLVPLRVDGTCRFAAIDIDVDTIDHAKLYEAVAKRRMPLHVCRSKSGGAHCYLFMEEPGLPATKVIEVLKRWANVLGYPSAEVFPKQTKVGPKNLGNWINLPYFGGDRTTRYALGPAGVLTLAEFLESIVWYQGQVIDEKLDDAEAAQMPPCLRTLCTNGFPEGTRNSGLFNIGVYCRKAHPDSWEDKLSLHNQLHGKPPLGFRELQAIVGSLGKTKYQYTCDQSPIKEHCDRAACLKLPFGVGHMPWQEAGSYDEFLCSRLRKLLTDPPRYILEVNGHDLDLSSQEFISFDVLRVRLLELFDIVVQPMKQASWETMIRDLLKTKEDIEAPEEASLAGSVWEHLHDFLGNYTKSRSVDDVLRGLPAEQDKIIVFRITDFQRYLAARRTNNKNIDNAWLYQLLREKGATHLRPWILGKRVNLWGFPKDKLNVQREDFLPTEDPPAELEI